MAVKKKTKAASHSASAAKSRTGKKPDAKSTVAGRMAPRSVKDGKETGSILSAEEKRLLEFLQSDNALHHQFFLAAEQPLAWEMLQTVNGHEHRFRLLAIRKEEIVKEIIAQHRRMISHIEEGREDLLYAELTEHLRKIQKESRHGM